VAVIILIVALQASSRSEPVDTQKWGLAEFVNHLQAAGVNVKVIPTRKNGAWEDSVYLSENPDANWLSFQVKQRNVENIEQWQGALWVERLRREGDTEGYVAEWGNNGCQIGRFVVFGDARLVDWILEAFKQ
jgi:hypothetical protein